MRAVLQRVRQASVSVEGVQIAHIGEGLLALVAISHQDSRADLEWMARKIVELRIFDDAAGPADAQRLYEEFIKTTRKWMPEAQSGQFQATMEVSLINSGPVTLILDSPRVNDD